MSGFEELPALYARWLSDVLAAPIPRESRASCSDCPMAQGLAGQDGSRSVVFHPSLKCCTYLPDLPNFLVGRILANEQNPKGRLSISERIRRRSAVTPLGLGTNAGYSVLYAAAGGEAFGRSPALKCPHFADDSGRCLIWENRNAVCSTYFCRHVRGAAGAEFWSDLKELFRMVEGELAIWCVLEVGGVSTESLRRFRRHAAQPPERRLWEELTGAEVGPAYDALWGEWLGREEEFFSRCAALVTNMSWRKVRRIVGPNVAAAERLAAGRFRDLRRRSLPRVLVQREVRIEPAGEGRCQVGTYSRYDPLTLDSGTLKALSEFDGRPLGEVLRACRRRGVTLSEDTVRRLADWAILGDPPAPAARAGGGRTGG